jgi:hypothetical protein
MQTQSRLSKNSFCYAIARASIKNSPKGIRVFTNIQIAVAIMLKLAKQKRVGQ